MTPAAYRPDIDGLRAVAVLSVIVFHACPAWLPGGFTGVDMFFVISGYLISGIIFRGQREGTFTYADFYARRVRRIFPALIAAVALCLAYGWLVLLPAEYEQLGSHAAAGTVFLQNVVFWRESGYFDTAAALKPLLHLWSLAVEEQIYLVFPPIVLVVLWMRWPVVPVLALLLAASLGANLVMAERSVSADFFLTPFRAWEFLAGAILAWIHDRKRPASEPAELSPASEPAELSPASELAELSPASEPAELSPASEPAELSPASEPAGAATTWRGEAASWAGIALLAAGLAWIDEQQPYPGWRALVPVLGTLLVIAAGQRATINRAVLALSPLVWIGLISYPLYLFHWPAISFVHIIEGDSPDPRTIAAAVAVSVALAIATYHGLEKRVRHHRSRWTVPLLLGGFLAVGAAGAAIWRGGIPPRPPSPEVRLVDEAIEEARTGWKQYWEGYRQRTDCGIVILSCDGDGPKTLFLGDSNVVMYAPRIRKVLEESGSDRGAVFVFKGSYCPVPGFTRDDSGSEELLMRTFESELASDPSIDRVVIAARWSGYVLNAKARVDGIPITSGAGMRRFLEALGGLIERCRDAGKRVTVVLEVPSALPLDPNRMLARRFTGGRVLRTEPYPVKSWIARTLWMDDLAAVAAAKGADVIDPVPYLSADGICLAADDDGPIRTDYSHLRGGFVRDHVTYLDATVAEGDAALPAAPKPQPTPPPEPRLIRPWTVATHGDARATLLVTSGDVMAIDIAALDDGQAWQIQVRGPSLVIHADKRYAVSFRARAAAPRPMLVTLAQNHAPWQAVGLSAKADLTTEWQDFSFRFTGTIDEPDAILRMNLGDSAIPVEFADVVIVP